MFKPITIATLFILHFNTIAYCEIPAKHSDTGQENGTAMRHKGLTHYWPEGAAQNIKEAIQYFKKSSALGDGTAAFILSWIYRNGEGVDKNTTEAQKWFDLAVQNGDPEVWFNIAKLYYDNAEHDGVERDFKQAFAWFLKAAKQDHATAQFALSRMYTFAEGRPQDLAKAMDLLHKSANGGNAKAMHTIALFYRKGLQVTEDQNMALHYYKMAVEQYKKDNNNQMAGEELIAYGWLQKENSDLTGTVKSFQEALTYIDQNHIDFGEIHMQCAMFLSVLGRHREALHHGLIGHSALADEMDPEVRRIIQVSLGILHGNTGNNEEAMRQLKNSLPDKYEDWGEMAILATSNLAAIYANMGDYDSAMSVLQTNELKHFDSDEYTEFPIILYHSQTPSKASEQIPLFYPQLLRITQDYLKISKDKDSLTFHAKALTTLAMLADHFRIMGDSETALLCYKIVYSEAAIYEEKEDPEWSYLHVISGIDINFIIINIFTLALETDRDVIALQFIDTFLKNKRNRTDEKENQLSYINTLETLGKQLKEHGLHEAADEKIRDAALLRAKISKETKNTQTGQAKHEQ